MSNRFPNDLINSLKADPNFNFEAFVSTYAHKDSSLAIRINPAKEFDHTHLSIANSIPWCENGFYLQQKLIFRLDPLFHAGCYSVLAPSSMFLDYIIRTIGLNKQPIKAVDMCAAAGRNSTLLNSTLHVDSLLIANEILENQIHTLQHNIVRWGYPNVVNTNNDPSAFHNLPGYFDLILLDAPCSRAGFVQNEHNTQVEALLDNIAMFSEGQRRILTSCQESLKTNGYLIYTTCSSSKEENEDILDWLIDSFHFESIIIPMNQHWDIKQSLSEKHQATGYRFNSDEDQGDCFFIALLKKKSMQHTFSMNKVNEENNPNFQHVAKKWIQADGLYSFMHEGMLHVFPKRYEVDLAALKQVLNINHAGTRLGNVVGSDLIPSHDLALSTLIRKDIQAVELELNSALDYLHKITTGTSNIVNGINGWILIQYKGINLGWVKATSNEIENYLPDEWSIIKL